MPPAWVGSCLNGPVQLVAQMGLPSTAGAFEAAELHQPQAAEIVRDDFGVPHIYAATMHDLFFLNGVAHAQDRLWQMHSGRMLAAGRLCEMVGAKALDIDKFARQLGFIVLAGSICVCTWTFGAAVILPTSKRTKRKGFASQIELSTPIALAFVRCSTWFRGYMFSPETFGSKFHRRSSDVVNKFGIQ